MFGQPTCIFLKFTGIPCPGCGLTRAFRALFDLDFKNGAQIIKYIIMKVYSLKLICLWEERF
mgnify:CR=1 FL=1